MLRSTPGVIVAGFCNGSFLRPSLHAIFGVASALTASSLIAIPSAHAAARPAFEMPFPCAEEWQGATYSGHGSGDNALDLNKGTGNDDLGELVVASASGTVSVRTESDGDQILEISHGDGWTTEYRHLNDFMIQSGAVSQGQAIAHVGNRGTTLAHLHYEQQLNGAAQHIYWHGSAITYSYQYNGPTFTSQNCSTSEQGSGTFFIDDERNAIADGTWNWGVDGDLPVSGDWNGDGTTGVGLFRPSTGQWFLDYNNNGAANEKVTWAVAGDRPVAGDWNGDGEDGIAVYRPSEGKWFFDDDRNGVAGSTLNWGQAGDQPIAGDFDGDGSDGVGLFRPSTGTFFIDDNRNGVADYTVSWGVSGDRPIAGDWDNNGVDGIGVFRPSATKFFFDNNRDGIADEPSVVWGRADDRPVAGNWDGVGDEGVGLFRPST